MEYLVIGYYAGSETWVHVVWFPRNSP